MALCNLMIIVLVASPQLQGFGTGAQEHSMCTIPDYSKESKRHKWGHMNVGDLINCFLDLCRLPTISIFLQCDSTRHSYNIAIMPTLETLKGSIKMAVILRRSRQCYGVMDLRHSQQQGRKYVKFRYRISKSVAPRNQRRPIFELRIWPGGT